MFLKHYREVTYRVPDPLHPGHTAFDRRMDFAGTHGISHNGVEYHADTDGWFDLPNDVANYILKSPGWCTPEMVDVEMVAGTIRRSDADEMPNTAATIKGAKKEKASKRG